MLMNLMSPATRLVLINDDIKNEPLTHFFHSISSCWIIKLIKHSIYSVKLETSENVPSKPWAIPASGANIFSTIAGFFSRHVYEELKAKKL